MRRIFSIKRIIFSWGTVISVALLCAPFIAQAGYAYTPGYKPFAYTQPSYFPSYSSYRYNPYYQPYNPPPAEELHGSTASFFSSFLFSDQDLCGSDIDSLLPDALWGKGPLRLCILAPIIRRSPLF